MEVRQSSARARGHFAQNPAFATLGNDISFPHPIPFHCDSSYPTPPNSSEFYTTPLSHRHTGTLSPPPNPRGDQPPTLVAIAIATVMTSALVGHESMSAVAKHNPRAADDALRQKKRSFDYLWRSGVAGGFAGCAVSFPFLPA